MTRSFRRLKFLILPDAVRLKALADNEGGWTEELVDLMKYLSET